MKMKNENEEAIWEELAKVIKRQTRDKALPCIIEISLFNGDFQPYLSIGSEEHSYTLLDFLKKLEKIGALAIQDSRKEMIENIDPYNPLPKYFTYSVFTVEIKKRISREDYNILWCGSLWLNLENGEAKYRKKTKFTEDTNQHVLLQHLMRNPNERFSYQQMAELLRFDWFEETQEMKIPGTNPNAAVKRKINDLVREIKEKLGIREKDNVFVAANGYRLRC